ncbi:MAG: hypothetical protein LUG83_05815 [Lachnospiraceae bacterium]|nr:hypothetical protein [Lachnospiraceae bacterium]
MNKYLLKASAASLSAILFVGAMPIASSADVLNGWVESDGKYYWYENGVLQGYDADNSDYRGKEIYDPDSDAWYWLDNVQGGAKTVDKDVYQESDAGEWAENDDGTGKWVRYNSEGHMVKGWDTTDAGTFYFDEIYGTMAKGYVNIGGNEYYFNYVTGIMEGSYGEVPDVYGWKEIDGSYYWYENGVRQGVSEDSSYRGKEIYDPDSDAWYWLDNVQNGAKAVSKDVYQESSGGKWVRYDSDGQMVKGWDTQDGNTYYFDLTTGAMAKGIVRVNGLDYYFDETTGILQGEYEGGELSYVWVKTRETDYNTNGSLSGYTKYEYDNIGNVTAETTYNNAKKLISEINYTYDDENRVSTYSYINYTNTKSNYTITSTYDSTTGLLSKEVKTDYEDEVEEIRLFTYKSGKLDQETITDATGLVISGYLSYSYDSKGNATKITYYDSSDNRLQYAQNTYYEYNGTTYLKTSLICDDDSKVLSGVAYERQGSELTKETVYTTDREISTYTVYDLVTIPEVEEGETYSVTSTTYNSSDTAIKTTTYEYTGVEIRS